MSVAPLQFLLLAFAGWMNRRQVELLEYLREENRILREQLGGRRLRFTNAQRRRLAAKGKALGRRVLNQLGGLVTPDTILRWYRELITNKYDGTARRRSARSGTAASLHGLVVQFATENPTWGYTRLRGALGNLGHELGFVIDLESRRVHIAGVVRQAHGAWIQQVARNLVDHVDGFLKGKRYLATRLGAGRFPPGVAKRTS